VVGVEPVDRAGREPGGEVDQQAGVGAVPAVDGLVGVAHEAEVGLVAEQEGDEAELGRVQVLRLVDEEVAVPPPAGLGERGVVGQEQRREGDEVVDIEDPALLLRLLVPAPRCDHRCDVDVAPRRRPVGEPLVGSRVEQRRLGPLDLGAELAGADVVGTRCPQRVTQQGLPVAGDVPRALPPVEPPPLQEGTAQGVERVDRW
jgi:hypothetical protein